MFKMLLLGWNDKQNIDKLLKFKKIKLGKDKEKFDKSLIEVSHFMPNCFLNGYSKHEMLCKDDFDMDELEEEEQMILYVLNYISINGIISIDKLLEILSKGQNFRVSKQKLKKLVKETGLPIIKNCVCCIDFEKEDFDNIHSRKIIDKYKIIDDIKKFSDEFEKNNNKLVSIFENYKLDEECAEELKPILLNTRVWTLNGFTTKEATQFLTDKLNGTKNTCNCSSSKKNKKNSEK